MTILGKSQFRKHSLEESDEAERAGGKNARLEDDNDIYGNDGDDDPLCTHRKCLSSLIVY